MEDLKDLDSFTEEQSPDADTTPGSGHAHTTGEPRKMRIFISASSFPFFLWSCPKNHLPAKRIRCILNHCRLRCFPSERDQEILEESTGIATV